MPADAVSKATTRMRCALPAVADVSCCNESMVINKDADASLSAANTDIVCQEQRRALQRQYLADKEKTSVCPFFLAIAPLSYHALYVDLVQSVTGDFPGALLPAASMHFQIGQLEETDNAART